MQYTSEEDFPSNLRLFKYYRFNMNAITSLNNNSLYFSSRQNFNDPFDSSIDRGCITLNDADRKAAYARTADQSHVIAAAIKANDGSIIHDYTISATEAGIRGAVDALQKNADQFGICCFSETVDSVLMWSHYSEDHKGFCVEFEVGTKPFTFKNLSQVTYPVGESERIKVEGFVAALSGKLRDQESDAVSQKVLDVLCEKQHHWAYEKEWRMFNQSPDKLEEFDTLTLKSIFFGLKAEEKNKKLIQSIFETRDVKPLFYQAVRGENRFELKFEELS